jgi:hypothetical protein
MIRATLTDPKLVHGRYGRQVEAIVNVVEGDYKGTTFKEWFNFGKDKDTGEEYVSYHGILYQVLSLVAPNLEDVLADDDLSQKDYEKFLKKCVKELDEIEILARVGVKSNKEDPSKRRNTLQPGSIGVWRDPEEGFEDLEMGDDRADETAA